MLFSLVVRAIGAANKWITIRFCRSNIFIVITILYDGGNFLAQSGPLNEKLTFLSYLISALVDTLFSGIVKMVHLIINTAIVSLVEHDSIVIFIIAILRHHRMIALF